MYFRGVYWELTGVKYR